MKAMNILVAMMTIAISTVAIETSAQTTNRATSHTTQKANQPTQKQQAAPAQKQQTQSSHTTAKHDQKMAQAKHPTTHNNHTACNVHAGHVAAPLAHNAHCCSQPVAVAHHVHTVPATPVVHHVCHSYVPEVGHIVDAVPAGYVSINAGGVNLYCALGHIFRPIIIDGIMRYIVE